MKNWIQPGNNISVVAPVAVNSGEGVLVGVMFGVAISTAASGETVEIVVVGVVSLPKANVAMTQGAKVYWDNTAKNVTTNVGTNTPIGCAIVSAAITDAAVQVRLNGSF